MALSIPGVLRSCWDAMRHGCFCCVGSSPIDSISSDARWSGGILAYVNATRPWRIVGTCIAVAGTRIGIDFVQYPPDLAFNLVFSIGSLLTVLAWLPFLAIMEAKFEQR